ncbi:MAG: PKD domain-containing protein, partial [Bacteroidetes bacterium]|nr:PKD domain-containing protein [Bacteroidota bacterium]
MVNGQVNVDFTTDTTQGCAPHLVQFINLSDSGLGYLYFWDFGNGNLSNLKNPKTLYFNHGIYSVSLTVISPLGDTATLKKSSYIFVFNPPKAAFSADTMFGCEPLTVNFYDKTILGSSSITQYLWDFGDGNTDTVLPFQNTYNSTGNFTVFMQVVDGNGCAGSTYITDLITVTKPKARFDIPEAICPLGTSIQPLNQSTGGQLYFFWDFGDSTFSTLQSPAHTYTTLDTFQVMLVISDSIGCTDTTWETTSVAIFITDFDFALTDPNCGTDLFEFAFFDSSQTSPAFWNWDFDDGNTGNVPNPVHTYTAPGTYNVRLIAGITTTCKDTIIKTLEFDTLNARFGIDSNTNCEVPFTVSVTDSSKGTNIVNYSWNMGDSTFYTTQNVTHTYTKFGLYPVTLIIADSFGCIDTVIDTIRIFPPAVEFVADTITGCAPLTAKFFYTSDDSIVSWWWDLGDSTTSTLSNPSHVYADSGAYDITLAIVTDKGCVDTVTSQDYIAVGPDMLSLDFTMVPDTVCYGSFINVQGFAQFVDSTVSPNFWLWIFVGSLVTQDTSAEIQATDCDLGTKLVELHAGYYGCQLQVAKFVEVVGPKPRVDANTYFCNPIDTIVIQNKSIDYDSVLYWLLYEQPSGNRLDSIVGFDDSIIIAKHLKTGSYGTTIVVTNFITQCTTSNQLNFTVDSIVGYFKTTPDTVCKNEKIQFTDSSFALFGEYTNYLWNFGDSVLYNKDSLTIPPGDKVKKIHSHDGRTTGTYKAPAHQFADTGNYVITLLAWWLTSPARPCAVFYRDTIRVHGSYADFEAVPASACVDDLLIFNDLSTDSNFVNSWAWNFDDGSPES